MSSSKPFPILGCAALTAAAVLVHGYHLGTDDAAIWVPAVKEAADPSLYPFGSEFFLHHSNLSLFPSLLGWFARWTHLPTDDVILLAHLAGVFLLLLAGRQLLAACFDSERAQWAGVALLAGTLSVPVAGTAIPIMDPYVTSRTLSTPFALFVIAGSLAERPWRAAAWLCACAAIHPQSSLYAAALVGLMELSRRRAAVPETVPVFGLLSLISQPLWWDLQPAHGPAREVLFSRTYFFVTNWNWYEWLGVIAPLVLLWCGAHFKLRGARPALALLLRSAVILGLIATAAGLLLVSSPRLENYTRLQPMRAFHVIYVVLFLVLGAAAGEYVLKNRLRRWCALFLALAASMFLVARAEYPASPQLEWPGAPPRGAWEQAFFWVRAHTPRDAVFALDPDYLLAPGEDMHGFRALAERSALADRVKDSGAVSLFPQLAVDWDRQVRAQSGWDHFTSRDFEKLAREYPVTWLVTRRSPSAGLECPYENAELAVCRIGKGPRD